MVRLSAFDLLSLSEEEQQVVRCLAQQPGLTLAQIAEASQIPQQQAEAVVRSLVRSARLVEQLNQQQRIFSVRFRRERQRVRNIPAAAMALLNQSGEDVLAQSPLTAILDDQTRKLLLQAGEARAHTVGEVCMWQGHQAEYVGLVRLGLLKRSHLQGEQANSQASYLGGGGWIGLSEAFSAMPRADTYTAVAESELICWPAELFLEFAREQAAFSFAIAQTISQQLHACAEQQNQAQLWVVDTPDAPELAHALAQSLAILAADDSPEPGAKPSLLWDLAPTAEALPRNTPERLRVAQGRSGLLKANYLSYPDEVQLDLILGGLQHSYQHIVCATGGAQDDEFLLRLRGRAHTLISITSRAQGAEQLRQRWSDLRAYGRPGQRQMALLDDWDGNSQTLDPAFHVAIPLDEQARDQALQEVYRRLTLNHTIGIFVPSTISVDLPLDTRAYVQSTLSFLGTMFGGATRNQAEGAWKSEESGLVVEQVTIVRSFVSKSALNTYLDAVIAFVIGLKKDLQQEAIAVDVDNQLMLI